MTDPIAAQHPYNPAPPPPLSPRTLLSLLSMIFGLVSLFVGFILLVPIAAIVLGIVGLRRDNAGRGFAATGIALGSVFLMFWSLLFGAVAYRVASGPDLCDTPGDQFTVTMTDGAGDPLLAEELGVASNIVLDRLRAGGLKLVGDTILINPNSGATLCVTPPGSVGLRELVTADFTAGIRPVVAINLRDGDTLDLDPSLDIDESTLTEYAKLDCADPENQGFRVLDPRNFAVSCDGDGFAKYLLGPEEISDNQFTAVTVSTTESGDNGWLLTLDATGAESLAGMTTKLSASTDGRVALTIDGVVVVAALVTQPIDNGEVLIYLGDSAYFASEVERIVGMLDLAIRGVVFEFSGLRR